MGFIDWSGMHQNYLDNHGARLLVFARSVHGQVVYADTPLCMPTHTSRLGSAHACSAGSSLGQRPYHEGADMQLNQHAARQMHLKTDTTCKLHIIDSLVDVCRCFLVYDGHWLVSLHIKGYSYTSLS